VQQLAFGITNLSDLSYGQLRLNPFWDFTTRRSAFQKIVAVPSAKWPRDMESSSAVPAERSLWEAGGDPGPQVKYDYWGAGKVLSTSSMAVPLWTTSSSSRN
jgi:hypothetical protein